LGLVHEGAEIAQIAGQQQIGFSGVSSTINRAIFFSQGGWACNCNVIPAEEHQCWSMR
jgi:hypothetical protein